MGIFDNWKKEKDKESKLKEEELLRKEQAEEQQKLLDARRKRHMPDSVLRNSRESIQGQNAAKEATNTIISSLTKDEKEVKGLDKTNNVLEQAAIYYANADTKKCIDLLIKHLNETKGTAKEQTWMMLFDTYKTTNHKESFDKLALIFSNKFGVSPPNWKTGNPSLNSGAAMGRNAISIDGFPSGVNDDKVADFLVASKEAGNSRIDLSRVKISSEDRNLITGIEKIYYILTNVRKLHIPVQLMGDAHIIEKISSIVEEIEGSEENDPLYTIFWKLLLEIYQWRGNEIEFEELALRYAIEYEESPESYFAKEVVTQDVQDFKQKEYVNKDGDILPDTFIDQQNIEHLTQLIEESLKGKGQAVLNFEEVIRLDYYSAGVLANFLSKKGIEKNRIIVENIIEPIKLLFTITGVSDFVFYKIKK